MSRQRPWNEEALSEAPAMATLQALGYTYVPPEALQAERASLREVILAGRLERALRRLNPWLSDDNVHKAVRQVSKVQAASLMEASELVHTALTFGISLEQDLGAGRKNQSVRFFDFDRPAQNEFVVTRQLVVKGGRKQIKPDVVLFVNGIPLVVIECKSPTIGDKWRHEALDQLDRYQELSGRYRGVGAPHLFHTVQVLVVTCGQAAACGTVGTPGRFYLEWKQPYPLTRADLARRLGKDEANAQEVLLHGVLDRANLLDIVRNFVVFERDAGSGRVIRKIPRYQQFAAVNKALARAAGRAQAGGAPAGAGGGRERGGVIWHTQGSGKSLSMLWLALKLRRDPAHENPTIVLVTDRRDLDDQIARTFHNCGYPKPDRAGSVQALRALLSGPGGRTVMTTVQKFQEVGGAPARGSRDRRVRRPAHPVLSKAGNVFVLADEAHRSQYGSLAGNLRQALPNAVFIGFTGTPIDKKDRSTLETFGPYIDRYTIEQAVADGATVPIFYEGRLPELRIIGQSLDRLFERSFADRSDEERAAIKKKYATAQAVAEAPRRIEAICLDLIDHYARAIRPNGFKAQVVAVSRDAAVTYKETLDRLNGPPSAVVLSASNKDDARLVAHHTSTQERKRLIERFLQPDDPLAVLIVCDMLLTGFDAPIEQVMYLDSPLKEHTLLQAIARVNRTAERKHYGLVVDYWGVSEALQEALDIFAPGDVQGAMTPKGDELPRLQARHAAAMRFFGRVRDRDDLEACLAVLAAEDVRADFGAALRRFTQSMDMLLPAAEAMVYADDLRWLGQIQRAACSRFRDSTLDIADCEDKVRALIEDAIVSDEVAVLIKQVSLFSPDFEHKLAALKNDEARASEMEHAIQHEIHLRLEEDPAYYLSLRERLEQIIEDRKARRIDAARQLALFEQVRRDMGGRARAAEEVGLSETGLAMYGLLASRDAGRAAEGGGALDEGRRALASLLEEALAPHTDIVDWVRKDEVQRQMRRSIKRQLKAAQYGPEEVERLAGLIIDLLKARKG